MTENLNKQSKNTTISDEHSSTGLSPQMPQSPITTESFILAAEGNIFKETDMVKTRSADPQRTYEVREDASTGFLPEMSLKNIPPFGVYVHWPYCLSKCPYCDFFSKIAKEINQEEIIAGYLDDLTYYHKLTSGRTVTSIFFGGGTPSLIKPELINKIISHIYKLWPTAKEIEISLEANPNTDNGNLFTNLKSAGINRLSLGVQALNDPDLRFLGRTHNLKQALAAIDKVLHHFNNHSMDLIYARPGQTPQNWQKELEYAAAFGFKHLSLYQLTIEEGTFFAKKGIQPMEEESANLLYDLTNKYLAAQGYPRYEVSNYSRPGFASRHNLLYWQGDDYLGIGPAAHGRLKLGNRFYALTHHRRQEELTPKERAEEMLLMGLRLTEGINKTSFKQKSGQNLDRCINPNKLRELKDLKLLEDTENFLRLTEAGFPVMNKIIEELYC